MDLGPVLDRELAAAGAIVRLATRPRVRDAIRVHRLAGVVESHGETERAGGTDGDRDDDEGLWYICLGERACFLILYLRFGDAEAGGARPKRVGLVGSPLP